MRVRCIPTPIAIPTISTTVPTPTSHPHQFWDIVNWEDHLEHRIGHGGKDTVINKYKMQVTKAEYIEFNMNLQRHVAMNGGDLGKGDGGDGGGIGLDKRRKQPSVFDEEVAARVAEREWEFDCQGRNALTYDEFFMSIFQVSCIMHVGPSQPRSRASILYLYYLSTPPPRIHATPNCTTSPRDPH